MPGSEGGEAAANSGPRRRSTAQDRLAGNPEQAHAHRQFLLLQREEPMPRIKHIALTTKDPSATAAFYKEAFGLQEIRRSPNGAVFLTDGYINMAILNFKTEKDADVGAHGPNFSGIHHFGLEVEDLDEAAQRLERAHGQQLTAKDGLDMEMAPSAHRNFEMKWAGPDGVVIDISHTGWDNGS
jgi:catechol 2,3-dioxygenase-like lactoylglutathione lyase family enzyme